MWPNTLVYASRADREALEGNLFDSQSIAATLEAKKEQLEEVNQNSMIKNEALQGTKVFPKNNIHTLKANNSLPIHTLVFKQRH